MSFFEKFEQIYKSIDEIKCNIPEIQRPLVISNVEKILDFQSKYYDKNKTYCFNGSISIGIDLSTGVSYLLDGHHRMNAYMKLRQQFPERNMKIAVDIFDCKCYKDIELTYEHINTNNPNPITKLGLDDYKILQSFGNLMTKQFKSYIKNTEKPNRPNINLEKIKHKIKDKQLITKCGIKTGEELFQYIINLNKYYSSLEKNVFIEWGISDVSKIIDKINKNENKLFLSLYSKFEWIDRLIEHITLKKPFDELRHISIHCSRNITKPLRKAVWCKNNGNSLNGICYCCKKSIEFDSFQCGHIIAFSLGGETNITNMEAICPTCNQNMGTTDLEEYKQTLYRQLS
jgi:hypothetical protein